jgi:tripartite-type tricarboxylate transporter receptor subunit TctC
LRSTRATFKHVPYDALRDFVPITHAAVQPLLLVAHPSFPEKTAMELIALAKARPRDITFSSPGFGTNPEISARLANDGAEVIASTPEEFGAYIRAETEKWAKVVKAAGIKPE